MQNTPDVPLDCRKRGVDRLLSALYREHKDHEFCPDNEADIKSYPPISVRTPPHDETPCVKYFRDIALMFCGVSEREFFSFGRGKEKSFSRRLFIYFARDRLGMSWRKIAESLGGFDTQAVRSAYKKIIDEISADPELASGVKSVNDFEKKAEAA